jgi:hypothetical protein
MPLMYEQNTLQMEWCLDCHRNPAKNLRPTSQIYNMAWEKPAEDRPVWCSVGNDKGSVPTAQSVNCVTKDPSGTGSEVASLHIPALGGHGAVAEVAGAGVPAALHYEKFTSQDKLGHFLLQHYKIRTPKDLTSCEVCHR